MWRCGADARAVQAEPGVDVTVEGEPAEDFITVLYGTVNCSATKKRVSRRNAPVSVIAPQTQARRAHHPRQRAAGALIMTTVAPAHRCQQVLSNSTRWSAAGIRDRMLARICLQHSCAMRWLIAVFAGCRCFLCHGSVRHASGPRAAASRRRCRGVPAQAECVVRPPARPRADRAAGRLL
jgi:hypothetical protein